MAFTQITFGKLIDRHKSAGVDEPQARAHAEALDQALRGAVATKQDLREETRSLRDEMRSEIARLDHKIDVAVRDITIRMEGIAVVLFGAPASIRFFG